MDKERVLYARVSTKTQLLDLDTQIDFLGKTYPGCRVVKDVASGMNWKRKNFLPSGLQEKDSRRAKYS
ncbi:MAG: recombinase family protein [Aphanizomenon flos-aquae KM1D3_PB]|jgi:predicted site-specific integrase-resolvase|nr:MAG: recombinase family protein [Aphanizomenon flos-aquae KM1D3_PB]